MKKALGFGLFFALACGLVALDRPAGDWHERSFGWGVVQHDATTIFRKDKPLVQMSAWSDETSIWLTYDGLDPHTPGVRQGNVVTWGDTLRAYPIVTNDGDDGVEVELILHAPPASNRFSFTIGDHDELEYLPQRPLTAEHIQPRSPGQTISCSETRCTSNDGKREVLRAENVVDSLAVYHRWKRNHIDGRINYAAGKFTHIYRIKAVDAKGAWTWGHVDYIAHKLIVEVPAEFFATAAYPVIVDPTFGYVHHGGTFDNPADNWVWALAVTDTGVGGTSPATPASSGVAYSVTTYGRIKAGTPHFAPALYTDVSGVPTSKLAFVNPGAGTAFAAGNADVTSTLAAAVTISTQYQPGVSVEGFGTLTDAFIGYDTPGGNEMHYQNTLAASGLNNPWPSTTTSPTGAAERWSVSVNYTAGSVQNGPYYTTSFPTTENPMLEGIKWLEGALHGRDWKDVRVTTGLAYGNQDGTGAFDDSAAAMSGSWNANQYVQSVVYAINQGIDANKEVEHSLHTTITTGVQTKYESNWNTKTANPYYEVVRWNGAFGSFDQCSHIVPARRRSPATRSNRKSPARRSRST
jgi:hypothetical protein